jgi:phage terminase large subunit GpA-like protein
MMLAAADAFRRYYRSHFRRRERLKPSRWCEKYIRLPAGKQETEPGEVRFDKRPYLREPIDCAADPAVSDIVFVGPTRIGKTFFLRMGLCWTIAGDPAPWMWVDSTEDKAKDVSKKELQPMIAANAILRERKPKNRHNFTDLRMLFPAAAGAMVGGNSDAQVAGDTVKRIFGNELDKWRGATDKEASIAELVRHRTESFNEERKHFWSSTPTLEEMQTWQYAMRGDQRKWECVCPRCGQEQFLVWENVHWDPAAKKPNGKWDLHLVKATARYSCVNIVCSAHDKGGAEWTGAGWTEDERMAAIRHPRAQWIPTAVGEPGWRSYLINGLYGPLDSNSPAQLAVDFLSAKSRGFYADRQDFWNSRMGLPWLDNVSLITAEKFADREIVPHPVSGAKESYFRGSVPSWFHPRLFIVGFDVQANRLPFVVRAFDWSGRSFLVDHGEVASWADLEQIQEDYRKTLNCSSYVIGDVNYEERRAETLEQIYFRKDRGWFGAEAFELAKQLVTLDQANVYAGGKLAGKTERDGHFISKFVISAYEFKVELEKRFTGEIPNWFCYQLPLAATEQEIEEQAAYYKQLLDERRVPRRVRIAGKPPFEFRSKNKYNHAYDCEVYICALFWTLQKRRSAAARQEAEKREKATAGRAGLQVNR